MRVLDFRYVDFFKPKRVQIEAKFCTYRPLLFAKIRGKARCLIESLTRLAWDKTYRMVLTERCSAIREIRGIGCRKTTEAF